MNPTRLGDPMMRILGAPRLLSAMEEIRRYEVSVWGNGGWGGVWGVGCGCVWGVVGVGGGEGVR